MLRRAGEWLRLVPRRTPVEVSWSQVEDEGGVRFLGMDLNPANLEGGEYEMVLEVRHGDGPTAEARRWIRIAPEGRGGAP